MRSHAGRYLALLPLAGCFYTAPVNSAPIAEIELMTAPIHVDLREPVMLSGAGSYDPDGEGLHFEWQWAFCGQTEDQCEPPNPGGTDVEYALLVGRKGYHRVFLQVKDGYNAHGEDWVLLRPQNRLPSAELQVRDAANMGAPFTLGQTLVAAVQASDPDGDAIRLDWRLVPPPGAVSPVFQATEDPMRYRVVPDAAGSWEVQVSVRDDEPDPVPVEIAARFEVEPDAPPCIAATSPTARATESYVVERAGGPRRFSVDSLEDDLDAYPLVAGPDRGVPHFRWLLAPADAADPSRPGAFALVPGRDLNDYVLDPAAYAPGERVYVRVEAVDRSAVWPTCDALAFTCPQDSTCVERVTWRVDVL